LKKKYPKKDPAGLNGLPIGIIPEWLLKAETGKGLWETLIPDKEFRESLLKKIKGGHDGKRAG